MTNGGSGGQPPDGGRWDNVSRRELLRTGAAAAAVAWLPAFRIDTAAAAADGCAVPPRLPDGIPVYRQAFENWARAILIDEVWTCSPGDADDVARLANWAHREGWRLRARGSMHNWSPLCVSAGTDCGDSVLLAETSRLSGIEMASTSPSSVRVGAGATTGQLARFLEERGHGLGTLPSSGEITIGGGLAIGMHGASLPASGESRPAGRSYGSLSNMVLSLTAVVWSRRRRRYVVRTFERGDADAKAFLVHLGRAFITEVTLRVGEPRKLRCVSDVGIPATELFGPPGTPGRTYQSVIEASGRAEAIWFPFTEKPWLKVWTDSPERPSGSRAVGEPYNYPFSDNLPVELTDLSGELVRGNAAVTPTFGRMQYEASAAGLEATGSKDIWGPEKNSLFYIRATTLRFEDLALVVLTRRRHIQRIVHAFASFHSRRLDELRAAGRFPVNGPLQLRCTGLDRPAHAGIEGAEAPPLSALVPRRDRRDFDVAIWFNVLSIPNTVGEYQYFRELERFLRRTVGSSGAVRPEWSKGWASSGAAFWSDRRGLRSTIPNAFRAGRHLDENWDWAVRTLDRHDPHRVFTSDLHDRLM